MGRSSWRGFPWWVSCKNNLGLLYRGSSEVQFGQRVALMGMRVKQKGHSLVVGSGGGVSFSRRILFTIRTRKKQRYRDDEERHDTVDERPVVEGDGTGFLGSDNSVIGTGPVAFFEHQKKVREIDLSQCQSYRGHDDVGNQGLHDGAEGAADNETYRQVDDVSPTDEISKLLDEFGHGVPLLGWCVLFLQYHTISKGGFPMSPVIFTLGSLSVRFYGLFMALAILVGAFYLLRKGKKRGFSEEHLSTMVLLVITFGLVGARLLFVAANFPSWFWEEPLRILKVYEGGLAWHGGLVGGVLAAFFYLRFRAHIDFHAVADLAVPGIALGYTLIRLANILNVENVGRMTGFTFGRWPVQLIAALFSMLLLLRHFFLEGRALPDGYRFWSFVFYHQIFRAGVEETLREMPLVVPLYRNSFLGIGFLTMVQLATPPLSVFLWWMAWKYLPKRNASRH